jgi:hypothetical protein
LSYGDRTFLPAVPPREVASVPGDYPSRRPAPIIADFFEM